MSTMSLPIGNWEINANGYEGTLAITNVDVQGKVTGSLQLGSTHNIAGTWDQTNNKLTFSYQAAAKGNTVSVVSYVGYFFLGGSPLFKYNSPTGGKPPVLDYNILTGSSTAMTLSSSPSPASSPKGWMARLKVA
jgi:hypothetical protein